SLMGKMQANTWSLDMNLNASRTAGEDRL
ncbi:MAG: hypothetical protein QOJ85_4513, partial [Solirubrobacteraceae bacterium]|nr:hypothetical protein [Solirubrobacteraceae bacterium]